MQSIFLHPKVAEAHANALAHPALLSTAKAEVRMAAFMLRAHGAVLDYVLAEGMPAQKNTVAYDMDTQALLSSAVSILKAADPYMGAAQLACELMSRRPFGCLNERTALLTAVAVLHNAHLKPQLPQRALMSFIGGLGRGDEAEVTAGFLRKHTKTIRRRFHVCTYMELNMLLARRGFGLGEPSGEKISVVEHFSGRDWRLRKRQKSRTLGEIPYAGMLRKVAKPYLAAARGLTGQTSKRGVDAKVFFHGVDPLKSLCDEWGSVVVGQCGSGVRNLDVARTCA